MISEMTVALVTAAGVHRKDQKRFNLSGDSTWREIANDTPLSELMVSHGGYDNSDVNRDVNCMFPIERINELSNAGIIRAASPSHAGFMGGGGDQTRLREEVGPQIAEMLKKAGASVVIMTAG